MNNKSYKAAALILALITFSACALSGCSPYTSSYSAVGFVHSNSSKSANMSFYEFKGSIYFTFKAEEGEKLVWSSQLESGDITVYYDYNGEKTELFKLKDGETNESQKEIPASGTLYVIVETDGQCRNGVLVFDIM